MTDNDVKIKGGYIICARKTIGSEVMDKPPMYMKMWLWMLNMANHASGYKGLKRGQFFTTKSNIKDAMSWYVGYRKHIPTDREIRSPYEWFMKVNMISTAKVTQGRIITILNYNTYQNPNNYEGQCVQHDASHKNDQEVSQYKQECKEGKERKKYLPDSEEIRLSELLLSLILINNPNFKKPSNIQMWATHIDRMIRLDKRTVEQIEYAIKWCQNDDFWMANILSTKGLRDKFDKLVMKIKLEKKKKEESDDSKLYTCPQCKSPNIELTSKGVCIYCLKS